MSNVRQIVEAMEAPSMASHSDEYVNLGASASAHASPEETGSTVTFDLSNAGKTASHYKS